MVASLTEPTPTNIAAWIVSFAFLVVLWNQVQQAIANNKDKPGSVEVRAESAEKFVSKEIFQQHVASNMQEHRDLFSRMGGMDRGTQAKIDEVKKAIDLADQKNEARVSEVHSRVNDVLEAVAEVRGELNAIVPTMKREGK